MARFRVGVDIGGTFTDFTLLNEETGEVHALKFPSDRARPAEAVFGGLDAILEASDASGEDITYFSHGTTLGVNTILEYNGARTALLVTRGFRDILNIGRHRLPDIFNFFTSMPRPLVRRAHVIEMDERSLADGTVLRAITRETVAEVVETLRRFDIEAVAVGFLHSYRNPDNEREVRRLLNEMAPDIYVSLSSEIWPQMREFERTLVGVMNAYVGRRMETYFNDVQSGLADDFSLGVPVRSTKSNGGVMTAAEAAARPTETLMSGPAAGTIGAAFIARSAGMDRVVTLDMGGTSTDVSIIDGEPRYSTENQVGAFPVIMPAVDVTSIGAGGGSIAWMDNFNVLKVGPRSAGARPGPAAYGFGGEEPTLTDAFVCLGIVDPGQIADGRVRISRELAEAAMQKLAVRHGRSVEETAEDVVRIATSHIFSTLVPLLARKGVDYHDFALLPFGGAGPMHGLLVARDIGFKRVVVPRHPGVLCATGALVADMRRDFVRTVHRSFPIGDGGDVVTAMRETFAQLEAEGWDWLDGQGLPRTSTRFRRIAEMRYQGQSFEIAVDLEPDDLAGDDAELCRRFRDEYTKTYGYSAAGSVIEVRDIRVVAIGETMKPLVETLPESTATAASGGTRKDIFHDGRRQPALFIDRAAIAVGHRIAGPAVIAQYDTTTFVPSGYHVTADRYGNLIAEAHDVAR